MSFRLPARRPRRPVLIGLAAAGALTAAAAVAAAQLLLPGYAESRLADRLRDRVGPVHAAEVGASPAVKLLWGDADRLALHLGEVEPDGDVSGQARRLREIDHVDARVDRLTLPAAAVDDLHVVKDGDDLTADLTLAPDALAAGSGGDGMLARLGAQARLQAGDGGALQLRLQGGIAGGATLAVEAQDGAIVASPADGGLLGLVVGTRTLAAPDGLELDALTAEPAGDGVRVSVRARTTDAA